MIVIIATKILPGEAGGGNNFRMLISRRRTPIDFEHAVTLSACDRAWHGTPSGEFWLRDELFEDGIVEYVDRGSRSHSAIHSCATSRAAFSAAHATAGRALLPPIRSSDRRKLTFQAMWGITQTESRAGTACRAALRSGGALQQLPGLALQFEAGVLMGLAASERRDALHEIEDALGPAMFFAQHGLDDLRRL